MHNGVVVSKAFNADPTKERTAVTGHAILDLQVGDKVNSMLTFIL